MDFAMVDLIDLTVFENSPTLRRICGVFFCRWSRSAVSLANNAFLDPVSDVFIA